MDMSEGNSSIFSLIGKGIHDLNELVFVKNKRITSWISVFLVIGLTYVVFNAEAGTDMLGRAEILDIIGSGGGTGNQLPREIKDYVEIQTRSNFPGDLQEGESTEFLLDNEEEKVLSSVSFTLSWNDENDLPGRPRVRRYENQPDEFSVRLKAPEGNSTIILTSVGSGETLTGSYEFNETEIAGIYGMGNLSLDITLVNCGDWVPQIGPGAFIITDPGNSFELVVDLIHLEPEEKE
jgi:hypothetical protein